jgi:hypothetical protein
MICFLSFDMAKDKGRPTSRRVPSIPAKGKERPPRREAGSLQWSSTCEAVGLATMVARPCGTHPCFRDCTPSREQRHVPAPAGSWMTSGLGLREIWISTIDWCSANRCKLAAAPLPMRCGRLRFGGHRSWRLLGRNNIFGSFYTGTRKS